MNKKQLLQMMFAICTGALLTTGCSNEEWAPTPGMGNEDASIVFNLGLPLGDEVSYTRATDAATPLQDATEWTLKTLKVYHFGTATEQGPADTDYKLVAAYNVPVYDASQTDAMGKCIKTADAKYTVKLSLRDDGKSTNKHNKFIFIANDSCSTFDQTIEKATAAGKAAITLGELKKCVADKQITDETVNPGLFFGDPAGLCMTAEASADALESGKDNLIQNIALTRIMARLDVKDFVPQSSNFRIKSVRIKCDSHAALSGSLFSGVTGLWEADKALVTEQAPEYTEKGYLLPGATDYLNEQWVSTVTADGRTGTWYKKVLYMYERPREINTNAISALKAEVTYSLNGWETSTIVDMRNVAGNTFDIQRNHVYTLQIGQTQADGGKLIFTFTDTPWTLHEMDADLNGGTEDK